MQEINLIIKAKQLTINDRFVMIILDLLIVMCLRALLFLLKSCVFRVEAIDF
jgi:hypothetical protein